MEENLYEILGVSNDASESEIKKAYRKLVKEYHPDTHPGDKDIEEKFKKINNAYTILNDPHKRAKYDNSLNNGANFFGDFDNDIFDIFNFNINHHRNNNRKRARRGSDIRVQVYVTLFETLYNTEKEIEYNKSEICDECNGTKAAPNSKPEKCPKCNGTGQVQQVQRNYNTQFVTISTCTYCNGTGEIIKDKCKKCNGTGSINKNNKIKVTIPKGVYNGIVLRMENKGNNGENGGPSGDLYIVVNILPNNDFERDINDLYKNLYITYPQAVLGDEVELETLEHTKEKIIINPGIQYGDIIKIKNKGLYSFSNPNIRGDLCIRILIKIPKEVNEEQRKIIEDLSKVMKD